VEAHCVDDFFQDFMEVQSYHTSNVFIFLVLETSNQPNWILVLFRSSV
jgi:hypothetical protein